MLGLGLVQRLGERVGDVGADLAQDALVGIGLGQHPERAEDGEHGDHLAHGADVDRGDDRPEGGEHGPPTQDGEQQEERRQGEGEDDLAVRAEEPTGAAGRAGEERGGRGPGADELAGLGDLLDDGLLGPGRGGRGAHDVLSFSGYFRNLGLMKGPRAPGTM